MKHSYSLILAPFLTMCYYEVLTVAFRAVKDGRDVIIMKAIFHYYKIYCTL